MKHLCKKILNMESYFFRTHISFQIADTAQIKMDTRLGMRWKDCNLNVSKNYLNYDFFNTNLSYQLEKSIAYFLNLGYESNFTKKNSSSIKIKNTINIIFYKFHLTWHNYLLISKKKKSIFFLVKRVFMWHYFN